MKRLAKSHLNKIKPYKPGKPIEELKRQLGLKDAIKMASNENALSPSSRVISSIAKAARDLNRYPDGGSFYLKKELAKRFRISPDNFIIGNGSDEVIVFAVRTFLKSGDEVIIAKPTFLVYDIASRVEGIRVKHVPLRDYRYDLESMRKAITKKTRMIFIANPDNPTGTYVTRKEVERFMSGLRRDIIVVFDEAYYEFASERSDYPRTMRYFKKERNVIILRTFSKIYSLAGLRVGYGIARRDLIESMNKVREPFNVNSLAQTAAIAAMYDEGFVKKTKRLIKMGKSYLYSELDIMGIMYIPSATNFILMEIGPDAPVIYKKLLKKGIIVRNMEAWGLSGFLRVTIGTDRENRRFIKALSDIWRQL
ncbi:MAG: histidinol-phosphate transaminase [Candidatus Omnitrophica bacterium]|nr:histidinol-phosphate transaminase [Candidatus Omnitrophota bacterium]